MKKSFAVFLLAALSCGCAGAPKAPRAAQASPAASDVRDEEAAVAAAMRGAEDALRDYKISAADLVSVTVYDSPELNRRARVNASGQIFLPLVGAVEVGGSTLDEAQQLIESKLAAYVVRPQVTLFIEEYGNKVVFVMGEVQKPGSYPIPTESRMSVIEAISTAGGFTPVAAQDRARVLRRAGGKTVNYTIDVRSITRGGRKEDDILLEPNDVVFVPQSLF